MNIFKKLKQKVLASPFARNLNEMRYDKLDLMYDPQDLTPEYYHRVQNNPELEHQIGRLQNFRDIVKEIQEKNLKGDFIEFGVWRGFSLLWTAYFCQRAGLFDRALIGVDGFIGLPNDDGVFKRGAFTDTSRKTCEHGLSASRELYGEIKRGIKIHQSLFDDTQKMNRILSGKKFVFLHIDCDIGSAALQLFQRLQEADCLADDCFVLFDDYGCKSSLGQIVDEWMRTLEHDWKISTHSSTKLTKNFHLQRR